MSVDNAAPNAEYSALAGHLKPLTGSMTSPDIEEQFFSVAIDMMCCLDYSGYFKRLNPAWERTLGFTIPELMARPFIEFVHPDDRVRTLNQNREVRAGGHALAFQNRYLCPSCYETEVEPQFESSDARTNSG